MMPPRVSHSQTFSVYSQDPRMNSNSQTILQKKSLFIFLLWCGWIFDSAMHPSLTNCRIRLLMPSKTLKKLKYSTNRLMTYGLPLTLFHLQSNEAPFKQKLLQKAFKTPGNIVVDCVNPEKAPHIVITPAELTPYDDYIAWGNRVDFQWPGWLCVPPIYISQVIMPPMASRRPN